MARASCACLNFWAKYLCTTMLIKQLLEQCIDQTRPIKQAPIEDALRGSAARCKLQTDAAGGSSICGQLSCQCSLFCLCWRQSIGDLRGEGCR